ncbi:glutamine-hydrolyzing GMP synthase [Candidatus Micrarchaeota archaeon]|nr:glutamine-hydrolyzing GMP synthase [Candidatus Micrarchaeota archaeon]
MILIIDNGSQYTHLIKRNCRELGFDAEMLYNKAEYPQVEELMKSGIARIILSGGPSSVYSDPPNLSSMICGNVRDGGIRLPMLGICYGHQMIAHVFGANVAKGASAEYGLGEIAIDEEDALFAGVPKRIRAWVSHFDEVKDLPNGFVKLAHSESCAIEAMRHREKPIFSVQFHPEVWHTEHGEDILRNFLESPAESGG